MSEDCEDQEDEDNRVDVSSIPSQFSNKPRQIEIQVLKYVCGYLLKKAQTSYKDCQCAKIILEVEEQGTEESDHFINLKQYKNSKLKYVSNYFLFQMTEALNIIRFIFNTGFHKRKIFAATYNVLCEKINFTDCEHNSSIKKSIFTYFIKIIGHDFIRQLNRILNGHDRRFIPANAPKIFIQCRDVFKKTFKK